MEKFYPERVFFEPGALEYPLGERLHRRFTNDGLPVDFVKSHNRLQRDEALSEPEAFDEAKKTLVVGVKKTLQFQNCRPSADYRLVTGTSCPGKCRYCYLAATLGPAVQIRVYVNIGEILEAAGRYIERNLPRVTSFEASSSSDPVAVEHLTGTLERLIRFFAGTEKGRLRVVTKFADVDDLLDLEHRGRTRLRFSLNTRRIVEKYEGSTSSLEERMGAARRVMGAGYPLGFIIAPLVTYPGWRGQYLKLLDELARRLGAGARRGELTFELIMHRFTTRARRIIEARYPDQDLGELEMDRERRKHKGFGKYVYPEPVAAELEETLREGIGERFPGARVEYFT